MPIMACGITGHLITNLAPNQTELVNLQLMPLESGVHKLNGLQIIDTETDKQHLFGSLGYVNVQASSEL